MQSTRGLALDLRLSAYIDGEVSEAERRELEQLLSRDEEARRILETLKAGNSFGNKAFEEFLHDPVPLAQVRRIKQGPGINPRTERVTLAAPRQVRLQMWPRALAASIALLMIGGLAGFLIGKMNNGAAPAEPVSVSRAWLDDVAAHHRLYARQPEQLVEVPASQGPRIKSWITESVGVEFERPDLNASGLTFEGARLLVAAGKPAAQLVYRNAAGDVFAVCFLTNKTGAADAKLTESIRDNLAMISWQKSGASYVVVGPSANAHLQEIAERVSEQI